MYLFFIILYFNKPQNILIGDEDDYHPMIQLSDDSSDDPIPLPLDVDELATPTIF